MARSIDQVLASPSVVDELEKYQRLVELQKQIIALAQQNQRAEQACDALREQMASEVVSQAGAQRNLRQKANRALMQLPGIALAKSNWASLMMKEPSAC
jgi:hypothetical protein